MKGLPVTFRLKRVDREIIEMVKEGAETKKIVKRTKLPYRITVKKIRKLQKLGLI